MQDQATPAPVASQVPASAPQQEGNPGQALAIIGLVLAFLPLQLIGLILSIIAKKRARKGSAASTISLIGIILNSILGVIMAIVIAVLAVVAWSGIQNAATANAFLSAVQAKDYTKALSYTEKPGDAATKSFLEHASIKVGTSHKQIDSAYNPNKDQQGFVYELTGGESKYAKVTVKAQDGGPKVVDFVFGAEKLNPTPREQAAFTAADDSSTANDSAETGKATSESGVKTAKQCVTAADIARVPSFAFYDDPQYPATFADLSTFFQADSTAFQYEQVAQQNLDKFAAYMNSLKGKAFLIEIMGSVSTERSSQAAKDLSERRARVLEQELAKRGVQASGVLSINTKNNESAMAGADAQKRGDIRLISDC